MAFLTDTGILLRLLERSDPQHAVVRQAVRKLRTRGEHLVTAPQNAAEFWNVCTRPAARGGLGLSVAEANHRLRLVERLFQVLPEAPAAYATWRHLLVAHGIMGVQVHDARLVALMKVHGITHILTLNLADFARFPSVTAMTPVDVLALPP